MKNLNRKITSILTSAVLATSALAMPAMSSSAYFLNSRFDNKYVYTNADGLFDSNTSHGWELYYEEQSMTKKELSTKLENSSFYPSFYVNYIQHFYDKYAFDFADINDSTVQVGKAVGILSKYYGELKKTDSITSDNKNFLETYENDKVEVTYYYEYDREGSPCNNGCSVKIVETTRDADKKISNEVMKDLYKEGLISSFYDIGQVGYSSFIQLNPLFYKIGTDTDIESLQSYLYENKLDYTVKLNDEKDPLYESYGYIIEPNKDSITLSESLDLAKKLHSEFGITPYAEIAESGSNAVGHNALDDYIKSQETTATEETKITDLRKIFDMLMKYLDEKYDVPSILHIEEKYVNLRFRYGAFKNDNEFEKADEDIKNFLKEKNVDISLVLITYENVSPEPTTDGTKITDLDEIYNILKPYMDEHYKDYIDNPWQLRVRNEVCNVHVGFGRDVFKDDDAKMQEARKDIMNFLEEKNVDTSLVLITFDVLSSGETTDPTETETTATEETTDKIELPTQEITNEPTKETTIEPKEIKVGDINGDNAIDSKDAVLVLKSYADALANNKTYYEKAADVNNDGKVDSKDAVEILKTYAKNLVGNKN